MDEAEIYRKKFHEASVLGLQEIRASLDSCWYEALGWLNFTVCDYFTMPAFFQACEQAGLGTRMDLLNIFNRVPSTQVILEYKQIARNLQTEGYPSF